jgi:hypothetical protein
MVSEEGASYRNWLQNDIGQIVKPFLAQALHLQPQKFASWLHSQLQAASKKVLVDCSKQNTQDQDKLPQTEYLQTIIRPVIKVILSHMCEQATKRGRRRQTNNYQMILNSLEHIMGTPKSHRKEQPQVQAKVLSTVALEYAIGDIVSAKLPGGALYFEGVVIEHNGDGTFKIGFDEDEILSIPARNIRKVSNWDTLEEGDKVKVKMINGCLSFDAQIASVNAGTYSVKYDGGEESEDDVAPSRIHKVASSRLSAKQYWSMLKNTVHVMGLLRSSAA